MIIEETDISLMEYFDEFSSMEQTLENIKVQSEKKIPQEKITENISSTHAIESIRKLRLFIKLNVSEE